MSALKLKSNPPLASMVRREGIILTDDDQLRTYANTPSKKFTPKLVNISAGETSFDQVCENAVRNKSQIITFFHDHFFGGGERTLHLTHPEFIECTRKMTENAEKYGVGIGASVTNPLDLGRNFKQDMGVGGQHRFFAEGVLSPDGSFEFNGVLSDRWCNNKGYTYPHFDRARLFAYTEEDDGSPYLVIRPESVREIPEDQYICTPSDTPWELSRYFRDRHMEIKGKTDLPGNRVFAVFYMDTPEMDYFHPGVTEYVHGIIDMYRQAGVEFMELYSDEMHIQFDWDFSHFGPYELPTRYMTENFSKELAKEDEIFADFDKALIYFGYDMKADRDALGRKHTQHVIGKTPAEMYRTFRLRRTYYETLQDKVVGMCCDARDYIRETYKKHAGWDPLCLGHATWQESPTCDKYCDVTRDGYSSMFGDTTKLGYCAYDYTQDYVYSSTVRECISGCYDYFKWNDYFSYGGNDFNECGWFDRNYYGGAMAASLGSLNRNQIASWGAWGFPDFARERFLGVSIGYGALRWHREVPVNWGRPRIVDVLYVYPKDLTSVEERFGSWMVQYGYANYCPADRIVDLGKIENGELMLGIAKYSTVVVGFEPYYNEKFLCLLEEFARQGGRVVWNSTPPADKNGKVPKQWLDIFGISQIQNLIEGGSAKKVEFFGDFAGVESMNILSDMLPDRTYAIKTDGEVVARADGKDIGTYRKCGKGCVYYFGCRLRDDQTGESGDGARTLFDVLKTLGAYGGRDSADNTETISRRTEYFATKFANGAVSLCRHYYPMKEDWEGGFGRNQEHDAEVLKNYKYLVPNELDLNDFMIEGHRITYRGSGAVQYRIDGNGDLLGFRGGNSCGITIDGKEYRVTEQPANTIFGRLEDERLPEGYRMGWEVSSNARKVDICFPIPVGAEIYGDSYMDGLELKENPTLSIDGSTVNLGNEYAVVILVK